MLLLSLMLACTSPADTIGAEVCNGLDDDGDGQVDEGAVDASTWYRDQDGDGHGDPADTTLACAAPSEAWVATGDDCNDEHAGVYPGAVEIVADEVDEDCDGTELCYVDADNDGWRPDLMATVTSSDRLCQGTGEALESTPAGDCDDLDRRVHPEADEHCDGVDEDCDGEVDEDPVDGGTWYPDADGDGYGVATSEPARCESEGLAPTAGDCDDSDRFVYPGAPEVCDGQANACDSAWSSSQEHGVVTFFTATSAVDLTEEADEGQLVHRFETSVGDGETLSFCQGSFLVSIEAAGESVALLGPWGAERTQLMGTTDPILRTSAAETLVQGLGFMGTVTSEDGGGIHQEDGELTVLECVFEGLETEGSGGAIYQEAGSLLVQSSVFRYCPAGPSGGAIHSTEDLVVEGSVFSNCEVPTHPPEIAGSGGAIYAEGSASVSSSDLRQNQAGSGEALWGVSQVDGCTFFYNAASLVGGGIATTSTTPLVVSDSSFLRDSGGAVYASQADVSLVDTTTESVRTDGNGAVVAVLGTGADLSLDGCTLNDSLAQETLYVASGDLVMVDTLVSETYGAGAYLDEGDLSCSCTSSTADCGFVNNLDRDGTGGAWVGGSAVSAGCDWTGNSPYDLVVGGESYTDLGEDASFSYP